MWALKSHWVYNTKEDFIALEFTTVKKKNYNCKIGYYKLINFDLDFWFE